MNDNPDIQLLAEQFSASRSILVAMGDPVRQHMMLEMMLSGQCRGLRVGEISARTNLSRPAVSHHLRILKEAEIIRMRREGTRNYYYFDADARAMSQLIQMLEHARSVMLNLPDRSGSQEEEL